MRRSSSLALVLLLLAPAGAAARSATGLASHPIAEKDAWRSLVLDPPSDVVYPAVVEVQGGTVADPDGLRGEGGGATVLDATGASLPALLLDLGVNTGGIVEVGVRDGTGAPVHLAYAEAQRYLTPLGDNVEGSLGLNDVPDARWDVFPGVAGTWHSPAVRGGQRWVTLSLDAPGKVTIDYVRVRVSHVRSAPADYTGHFLSDDDVVNRAW